jgi:hypothetical protein
MISRLHNEISHVGIRSRGDGADVLATLRALPGELVKGLNLTAVLKVGLGCALAELQDPAKYDPACRPAYSRTQIIDGTMVTGILEDIIRSGKAHNVPIIIRTTASDLFEFFPPSVSDPYQQRKTRAVGRPALVTAYLIVL